MVAWLAQSLERAALNLRVMSSNSALCQVWSLLKIILKRVDGFKEFSVDDVGTVDCLTVGKGLFFLVPWQIGILARIVLS